MDALQGALLLRHNVALARDAGRAAGGEHRRGGEPVRADEAVLRVVVEGAAERERREEHAPHCEEEGVASTLDMSQYSRVRGDFSEKSKNTHASFMPGGKTGNSSQQYMCTF